MLAVAPGRLDAHRAEGRVEHLPPRRDVDLGPLQAQGGRVGGDCGAADQLVADGAVELVDLTLAGGEPGRVVPRR
jgi:hypothetical protein